MAEEKSNRGALSDAGEPAGNAAAPAQDIIDAAMAEAENGNDLGVRRNGAGMSEAGEGPGNPDEGFKGLPMDELISHPPFATAEYLRRRAAAAWDFYRRIVFDDKADAGRAFDDKTE